MKFTDCAPNGIDCQSDQNRGQPRGNEAIALEDSVMRNDSQFFHARLGHEHPIERVAMDTRKPPGSRCMAKSNR